MKMFQLRNPTFWVALLAGLSSLVMCNVASAAVIVSHFDFNGPTISDSIGTASGTAFGGATISGGNLVLDGIDDYVELDQKIIPGGATTFSVSLYAQQSSVQSGNYVELISQGSTGGPGFYIGHDPWRGIRLSDQFLSTGLLFPNDGLFHNYVLTSGIFGTKFYIDSVLSFSSGTQLNITAGGTNTRFGKQFSPFSESFHGLIGDVRVYDGVLSQSEIGVIQNEVTSVPEPGMLLLLLLGMGSLVQRRVVL